MARRRDRQELGQALHDPEDERLPVCERSRVVPHSEERQDGSEGECRPRDAEDHGAAHRGILRRPPANRAAEEIRRKLRQSGEDGA